MNDAMNTRYPTLMRLLHWLMAALILGLIAIGWYMTDLDKEDPSRGTFYMLHKSLGVLVLGLIIIRIVVRLTSHIPALPNVFSGAEKKIIHLGHIALYVLMLLVPLSGYLMSCAADKGVKFFGVQVMCLVAPHEGLAEFMNETHEIIAYLLLIVVIGHVAAVIKHARDPNPQRHILTRMK